MSFVLFCLSCETSRTHTSNSCPQHRTPCHTHRTPISQSSITPFPPPCIPPPHHHRGTYGTPPPSRVHSLARSTSVSSQCLPRPPPNFPPPPHPPPSPPHPNPPHADPRRPGKTIIKSLPPSPPPTPPVAAPERRETIAIVCVLRQRAQLSCMMM